MLQSNMTADEREALAYIKGHTQGAALLGELADAQAELDDTSASDAWEAERAKLQDEIRTLEEANEAAADTLYKLVEAVSDALEDESIRLGKRARQRLAYAMTEIQAGKMPNAAIAAHIRDSLEGT